MRIARLPAVLLAGLLPVLPLCSCGDPYTQAGTWHAEGVGQANLDAEAVNPADTIAGHGTAGSDAVLDAAAVLRLHQDKTKPLKDVSTTSVTSGTQ